uniref:Uncharacterized protein n=1 Tax=Timema genevievae TaxID=629358 RepID=A0A7R9PMQ6_TIMGE|nr:unnamed protein product [Timema genevievae]
MTAAQHMVLQISRSYGLANGYMRVDLFVYEFGGLGRLMCSSTFWLSEKSNASTASYFPFGFYALKQARRFGHISAANTGVRSLMLGAHPTKGCLRCDIKVSVARSLLLKARSTQAEASKRADTASSSYSVRPSVIVSSGEIGAPRDSPVTL